ncbi:39157_t:CDS:2 [Gigaspora margarita]|uniref:39157_t:CDS:1 n=1 Tax=Gigaspora margarita TaxID=4874 RepID=A0ABN7V244_GIGMA|nr:39157_t:CDS:2 [Gigaspora margarita]
MVGSLESVELNLPLTRQQPSAMLDSSEGIDLDLYQDQYSSNYSSEPNVLYEDFYSEIQYEEYSHDELTIKRAYPYAMMVLFGMLLGYVTGLDNGNLKKKIDPDEQRNCNATVISCKWHCNFSIGSKATTIRCSLIDDDSIRNHSMDPKIYIY